MAEVKAYRFTKYFPLLLDALRSTPNPMRPVEAIAWIKSHSDVPAKDLMRLIENGKQTTFENDVHWARFYLAKAKLIGSPKRGLWALTPQGVDTHLSPEDTWALYVRVRDATHLGSTMDEEKVPAPQSSDAEEDGESYWFVGALWNGADDQTPRFLSEGIWENGYDDQFSDLVRRMKPGDRIAIKASFVQKRGLPFDVGGKPVSVMRIKATGTVKETSQDGKKVNVAWEPSSAARDWYFFTYRTTVVEANMEREDAQRLVNFVFHRAAQDYAWFLNQPYWADKYGAGADAISKDPSSLKSEEPEILEAEDEPAYTVADIVNDGCFIAAENLQSMLDRWSSKKNLVLQGPPGTGKTWLAKRLGYALVGSKDRETTRSRIRVVQFHPSLAYEDFVRGWRPAGEGRLELVDGLLMEAVEAALSEPDRPYVLVIEEINRGNPAQIFGEMLTLLESTKRNPSEAIELAYRRKRDERVHVPNNLYVIGTMNVADRSLAIVDLALRRRFAFVDLEPNLGPAWRAWCSERGLDEAMLTLIETRIVALNLEISSASSLGPQFRIGHSYVTPEEKVGDGVAWFRARIETEIGPLLDEYWYDSPERAKEEQTKLFSELP
ncbi:AAA family ATPase [Granulicella mallensis]|uniref:5-methylcytosine-specific restriction protein B n=1 Tax=Granulicella mallensis TaxID=940614 RepID=A0A7W7ZPU9_9BACT|nr:AAA family ATPase [Granulicella mallensis]MBB5063925.1 5-methylcytosine-specific restriction protein B [Granulicella mallensis]